jgi:Fe-S-cluster containining protein
MSAPESNPALANYRELISRLDRLCENITSAYSAEIACRAGCSSCCRHLNLFAVEAAVLAAAVAALPQKTLALLAARLDWPESGTCPLLVDDCCAVYASRPVICRSHGMPLLLNVDGERKVDFCRDNFRGVATLSGTAVIDLETVNQALAAINEQFTAAAGRPLPGHARLSIAAIIKKALISGDKTDDPA